MKNENYKNLILSFLNAEKADGNILHKIFEIYEEANKDFEKQNETNQAFTSIDAEACFLDHERTWILGKMIQNALNVEMGLKPISTEQIQVLEAGSGTGIIAIFAALSNPNTKITCLEINPVTYQKSLNFIKYLGLEEQIQILNLDASKLTTNHLPLTTFDIIFSETLSGGLFFEPQIQITNNIKKFLKPNGILIPQKIELFIELEDTNLNKIVTEKIKYFEKDLLDFDDENINADINFKILEDSSPNLIIIKTKLWLTEDVCVETDKKYRDFLNRAIIAVPYDKVIVCKKDDVLNLKINYIAGENTKNCKIDISKNP